MSSPPYDTSSLLRAATTEYPYDSSRFSKGFVKKLLLSAEASLPQGIYVTVRVVLVLVEKSFCKPFNGERRVDPENLRRRCPRIFIAT